MQHDGHDPRTEANTALHALLAGAEGCGPAARSTRLAHDDELADFLSMVQEDVVEDAVMLLEQPVAE